MALRLAKTCNYGHTNGRPEGQQHEQARESERSLLGVLAAGAHHASNGGVQSDRRLQDNRQTAIKTLQSESKIATMAGCWRVRAFTKFQP